MGDNAGTILKGTVFLKVGKAKTSTIRCDVRQGNFKLCPQISMERLEMSTSGKRLINYDPSCVKQKLVNFGPLTLEITRLMFTHPKSTVRVLCMLMHWSAGHVILLPGKFHSLEFHPPPFNRTYGSGRTHVGLCPNFQFVLF